ncbi:MAG TPA: tetratricopeptide repeat protein, partial [Bryobacteraceae bacterium]|nr:tetratricopeptide repeat protein [Bryobacteraceae bacterium]
LLLERFNAGDATGLFQEALKIDPGNSDAYVGLARVAAENFDKKAVEFADKALELNPKNIEAEEILASVVLEDDDQKLAAKEAQKALVISPESLDAMSVLASIDWLNDKPDSPWVHRILKINPHYGEAYATGAHFLVINRRYEEGIQYYRKALSLNPKLLEARAQLGINLMRLGQEDEARKELVASYEAGYRNAETVNSLRLLDSYKNFETFRTSNTILMLDKKEAGLLRPYIQPEFEKAIAAYQRKYKMTLPGPVRLEVYPNHADFAVRTLGLPGIGALVGVTFGMAVAMDSPSARTPGEFHWASTMWHELSHVYVLTATQHRVPRWFTEGLAVHEETAVSPDWGDRMSPHVIAALQKKQLLPVLQLDRGFVHPEYPSQVVVSYFQAGKICDYIAQKWGNDTILAMIHSFADRKTTEQAIRDDLHESPDQFDKEFFAWLDGQTKDTVAHFDEWKKRARELQQELKQQKYDDAIRNGTAIRDWYPDFVEEGSVYEALAKAYLAKNDKPAAIAQLEKYSQIGGRSPDTLKELAKMEQDAGNGVKAAATLNRLNYIYPEDAEAHKRLGDLWLAQGNTSGAIREFQAVVALKPVDPAGAHYELARAFNAARKKEQAREEVLLALEAAPDYKPAQKLLLELNP